MRTLNFSIDIIEPGEQIVFIENGAINEETVSSVELMSVFIDGTEDIKAPQIKYNYKIKGRSDGKTSSIADWAYIFASDYETLIDKLDSIYYKGKDKPGLPRGVEQEDMFASDEDIARRTTYLCSDGKFYSIYMSPVFCVAEPVLDHFEFFVHQMVGVSAYTLSECESALFDAIEGCEICRIIEDDKGRFIIEDRMCEDSGFIFMSLNDAKLAAWWLMEEQQ